MRGPFLVIAAVAALGLAGCTEQTAGTATAGDEPTSERPAEDTTSSAEPDAGVQPCSLLSTQDAAALGLTGGQEGTTGGARDCRYRYEGTSIDDSYTVGVAIFDDLGFDDVNGMNLQHLPDIGDHEAVGYVPPAGGCAVSLKTSDSSRVDILAVGGADQKACSIVMQVATSVEPELP